MTFKNGYEMLDCIKAGYDFYSKEKEIYVFVYNDCGSICYYNIDNDEADKLRKLKEESPGGEEYWGAFLGIGGWICDDPSYELFDKDSYSNLDWCKDNYDGEWEVV